MNYIKLFEDFNDENILSITDIKNLLNKYSIPIDVWGTGNAKTIESLFNEIKEKDCFIIEENDQLIRMVNFVGVQIYYKDLVLKEEKQVFNDGRVRVREMSSSVAEKMKMGEDPIDASIRGIQEELGIYVNISGIKKINNKEYFEDSMSYPGLKTKYVGYQFEYRMSDQEFKKDGYVDRQSDKVTYFKWV